MIDFIPKYTLAFLLSIWGAILLTLFLTEVLFHSWFLDRPNDHKISTSTQLRLGDTAIPSFITLPFLFSHFVHDELFAGMFQYQYSAHTLSIGTGVILMLRRFLIDGYRLMKFLDCWLKPELFLKARYKIQGSIDKLPKQCTEFQLDASSFQVKLIKSNDLKRLKDVAEKFKISLKKVNMNFENLAEEYKPGTIQVAISRISHSQIS